MVSDLKYDRWKEPGGQKYYTVSMLKQGLRAANLVPNTSTVFIQRDKTKNLVERCWQGTVYGFQNKDDGQGRKTVSFTYSLNNPITCPPEFEGYLAGWYPIEDALPPQGRFNPPFVEYLLTTNNWQGFETYVSWLLRFLGIHNLYTFETRKQQGKSDGLFKLAHLVVIYDATLNPEFRSSKKEQISNFCSQLNRDFLEYEGGKIHVTGSDKQVWIITKGQTQTIDMVGDITVKEISVQDLVNLNEKRMLKNLDEKQLANELEALGNRNKV